MIYSAGAGTGDNARRLEINTRYLFISHIKVEEEEIVELFVCICITFLSDHWQRKPAEGTTMKDVQIKSSKEECAEGMEQSSNSGGCTNNVINGGVYRKHGAKTK
eukprot:scaffold3800_cov87-Skeletonema_dohrnii-CCMP3373.AAC.6